jgi:hypothetical protein
MSALPGLAWRRRSTPSSSITLIAIVSTLSPAL